MYVRIRIYMYMYIFIHVHVHVYISVTVTGHYITNEKTQLYTQAFPPHSFTIQHITFDPPLQENGREIESC